MKMDLTTAAAAAAALSSLAVSSPTSASTIFYVTNVTVNSLNTLSVNGVNDVASAIGLTIQGDPNTLWVFCVDINHTINIGAQNPPLAYEPAPVTTDSSGSQSGTGNPISQTLSGELGTLASIGSAMADSPSPDAVKLTAIAGAIWQLEYGATVTGTAAENSLISSYAAYATAHPETGFAEGLYPVGPSGQGFGFTQAFTMGVPEPAAWTTMFLGLGGLGAFARRRRVIAAA
jgi:MYXO-CTERM domain-containing protein